MIAKSLSDEDIDNLAAWFNSIQVSATPLREKSARGTTQPRRCHKPRRGARGLRGVRRARSRLAHHRQNMNQPLTPPPRPGPAAARPTTPARPDHRARPVVVTAERMRQTSFDAPAAITAIGAR